MQQPAFYEIRVEGLLRSGWSEWFAGLSILPDPEGATLLSGIITDQAALHGVLMKIRDLGLVLVSLRRLEPPPSENQKRLDQNSIISKLPRPQGEGRGEGPSPILRM
jgi:hypothetical protein